jgi:hypothetical protein
VPCCRCCNDSFKKGKASLWTLLTKWNK